MNNTFPTESPSHTFFTQNSILPQNNTARWWDARYLRLIYGSGHQGGVPFECESYSFSACVSLWCSINTWIEKEYHGMHKQSEEPFRGLRYAGSCLPRYSLPNVEMRTKKSLILSKHPLSCKSLFETTETLKILS